MQTKTTTRYHLTHVNMAIQKQGIINIGKNVEKRQHLIV